MTKVNANTKTVTSTKISFSWLLAVVAVLATITFILNPLSFTNFLAWLTAWFGNLFSGKHTRELCPPSFFLLGTSAGCDLASNLTRGQLSLVVERMWWSLLVLFALASFVPRGVVSKFTTYFTGLSVGEVDRKISDSAAALKTQLAPQKPEVSKKDLAELEAKLLLEISKAGNKSCAGQRYLETEVERLERLISAARGAGNTELVTVLERNLLEIRQTGAFTSFQSGAGIHPKWIPITLATAIFPLTIAFIFYLYLK